MFPGVDKVVHFIMFATLAVALLFDLSRSKKATSAGRVMAVAGVAVDELLQECLTDNRSGEALDWLADAGGVAAVLLIFSAWRQRHQP